MDNKRRVLLQTYQHELYKDLDVNYILDDLFSKGAISREEFDQIYLLNGRRDRVKFLVDNLIQAGTNNCYDVFVDSLMKDYRWLWEKLAMENNNQIIQDSFEDCLSRGNVPRLPSNYVQRVHVESEIANALESLTRHQILALYGMLGCGKTTAAISVLRNNPELITNKFNGVIYWLNLGNCKTEDEIIAEQNKLYRKASSSNMHASMSMSSIGSNADISISSCEWNWQDMRDRLKTQFSDPTVKESLLVLDELNEKICLDAFDIGCKILVTTRDVDVFADYKRQIIKIENSLTESETLNLFALCLEVDVKKLPRQAKKLHEICKGSPFHLALLSAELAENKEKLVHEARHWNYYLNKLEKKDYFFMSNKTSQLMKTVEFCINSLQQDKLQLFKMLAILPDNAKISAHVLSKLWKKDVSEVDSIMKQLTRKSLILGSYDQEQRNYIYEIHDLIMGYLRSSCNEEEMKKLHTNFLKNYNYDSTTAPVDIEDDGYIAFYIGYHILHTKNMNKFWGLFHKLFLNLKFLGNKVRLTGPSDVMLDLKKYENYIAEHQLDKVYLMSIIAYLSTYGVDLYKYPSTDIVQSILQHESKDILYTNALKLAQDRCAKNELYFEFLHEPNVEEIKHSTIDVKESISSVCFLGNYVVVGAESGFIKFFDISTNKLKKELESTKLPIKWIGACPINPPLVAALAFDGVIKIWYIDDVEQDDVIEEEPEDTTDSNWGNTITITPKLGHLVSCRWANHEEKLFAHTQTRIIIYSSTGQVLQQYDNLFSDREILCCIPCNNDRRVIVATTNRINSLEVVNLDTKERESFEESDPVLDIIAVPGSNKVITLKAKEVRNYELRPHMGLSRQNCNNCRWKTVVTCAEIKDCITFTSVAVNKNGTLLFVATDDSRIICVDLKNDSRVFDLENRRGNVVSMAVSEMISVDDIIPGLDVLLTGSGPDENSAKVWFLDPTYVSQKTHKNGNGRLTTKFDVSFASTLSPQTPVNTAPNSGSFSATNTPKRNKSFDTHATVEKGLVKKTMSLDRHSLKPLNLKGICNGNSDSGVQPLLAVIDDKNHIQIFRGKKLLTEISPDMEEQITTVKISPCNHYIMYGHKSGVVQKYALRSKENVKIMDVYSPVRYMDFVNDNLMVVAGENRCLMAYRLTDSGLWKTEMLQQGNANLGSQELLNGIQGIKIKKYDHAERGSSSSSESSISSSDRYYPSREYKSRCLKESGLIDCYWIELVGLITVEDNATVKLWDQRGKLTRVLNWRQTDICITCSAFQKNVLVLCDSYNKAFQTFELNIDDGVQLSLLQDFRLNNRIISCDLTVDGNILAMGLDTGDVVLWNIRSKAQLKLLKHHKTKVQCCRFSPIPDRLYRSAAAASPSAASAPPFDADDGQPPLVLVTAASEIVWWDVTYVIRTAHKNPRIFNVITPIASPLTPRNEVVSLDSSGAEANCNFFFGDGLFSGKYCWKANWKHKKSREGSKRKEMLACIKLSGINAEKVCHDDKFSCFVTVDNVGHIHIMNLLVHSA